jgi:hypothetical protein
MTKASETMFVTGFTRATKYQLFAQRLTKSLDEFGLNYMSVSYEPHLTWEQNCCMKPSLIEKAMKFHDGPVVWVDADAELLAYPYELLNIDRDAYDFSAREIVKPQGPVILSGCMWFSGSDESKQFVSDWVAACQKNQDVCDQSNLQNVANHCCKGELSPGSCFIPDIDGSADTATVYHHPLNVVNKSRGQMQHLQFYKHLSDWLSTVATHVNIDGKSTAVSRCLSLYIDLTRNTTGSVVVDTTEMKDGIEYLIDQLNEWHEESSRPKRAAFFLNHVGDNPSVLEVAARINKDAEHSFDCMSQEATSIAGKSLWLFDFASADHETATVS